MADEQGEVVQLILPPQMARWLKARAVRHDRSVSPEGKSLMHFAMQSEHLLGPTEVHFATATAPGAA